MVTADKSQGRVAPRLRRGESFDYYSVKNLLLSFLSKNFKNRSTHGKVVGKNVDWLTRRVQKINSPEGHCYRMSRRWISCRGVPKGVWTELNHPPLKMTKLNLT